MNLRSMLFIIFLSVNSFAAPKIPSQGFSGIDYATSKMAQFNADSQKGAAFIFLSAHCPCSASHEVKLKKLAKEYPDVRFIGVHSNVDEDLKIGQSHFAEANLGFPVIRDEKSRIADALGATKTPHVYLFTKTGELAYQGGVDDSRIVENAHKEYFQIALEAVRAGKLPEVRLARTLGCSIQRE